MWWVPPPVYIPGQGLLPARADPALAWGAGSRPAPMCLSALQVEAPGNATSATLGPLSSSTTYSVRVTCLYPAGGSSTLTGRLTTREWLRLGWGPQAGFIPPPMDGSS